eukprot:595230-Hanusia_phi.AAC.1
MAWGSLPARTPSNSPRRRTGPWTTRSVRIHTVKSTQCQSRHRVLCRYIAYKETHPDKGYGVLVLGDQGLFRLSFRVGVSTVPEPAAWHRTVPGGESARAGIESVRRRAAQRLSRTRDM